MAKIMASILSKHTVSSCFQVIHSANARCFDRGLEERFLSVRDVLTTHNHPELYFNRLAVRHPRSALSSWAA